MKIKILQKKQRGREDSFWYDGVIAAIGDYILIATGDIRVTFPSGESRKNDDAMQRALELGYKDEDLSKLGWINNNWFEVIRGTEKGGALVTVEACSTDLEEINVSYDYDGAIENLKAYYEEKILG